MLICVKSKDNYFWIFFRRLLFELFFKILPYLLTIKVRGLIFFNEQALKSWTRNMYHTPLSQL